MMRGKDHFSGIASSYVQWRPTYPDGLFEAIAAVVPAQAAVWEPGCGSGQATRDLAARFASVYATDISTQQLEQHWARTAPQSNVTLAVESAESTVLAASSVDLIATGQALHWFNRSAFFDECERVLRPGGVLAAWTYQDVVFQDEVGPAVRNFLDAIDAYWPPERVDVDLGYDDIVWPDFEPLPAPRLWLRAEWTLEQLLGYFHTLSAVNQYREQTGYDAIVMHASEIIAAWGDPEQARPVRWPLILHLRCKPLAEA